MQSDDDEKVDNKVENRRMRGRQKKEEGEGRAREQSEQGAGDVIT